MEIIKEVFNILPPEPEKAISKKELRLAMKIGERTFTKQLSALEPEIIEIFPKYNKKCSLLNPRVARFIVDQLGYDIESIRQTLKESVNYK